MKTKLLLLALLVSSLSFAQYTAIPDANFENALSAYDDIANDGQVPTANIDTITNLSIYGWYITDLTGIEDFTALSVLDCSSNFLSSLDVSHNTNLTELYCFDNYLNSLDVSQNTNLTILICSWNHHIASLDVSQNTNLSILGCSENQITSLDVSQNTNLTGLYCAANQLNSLDISLNTNLTELYCSDNQLNSLDVSQNTNLTYLGCSGNQYNSLDISRNTNLTELSCSGTQLTNLDLSQNTNLITLFCSSNDLLASLDLSQNTNLIELYCFYNQLSSLNVKNGHNTNIITFVADNNPNLTCIEVDDVAYSTANWTNIDSQTSFSTDCAAGVDESALNEAITIYPNPVNHILNLSAQELIENVSIYNVTGQEVINIQPNTADVQVDMSKLQKGIYFVKAQIKGQVRTFKVVKK